MTIEQLMERVSPEPNTGCWLWTGAVNRQGYGRVRIDKKHVGVHRLVYELTTGKALGRLFGCHSCDTPLCVNPQHIFAGTQKDNMADASLKGRIVGPPTKDNCKCGEPFSLRRGAKVCRPCERRRQREYYWRIARGEVSTYWRNNRK